jgi:hypothetical protein
MLDPRLRQFSAGILRLIRRYPAASSELISDARKPLSGQLA